MPKIGIPEPTMFLFWWTTATVTFKSECQEKMLDIISHQGNANQNHSAHFTWVLGHFTPTTMAVIRKGQWKRWWGCGQVGVFMCCCWECKMVGLLWKSLLFLKKVKYRKTVWPSSFTPRYIPKKIEKTSTLNLYTNVHLGITHTSPKVEVTQLCIRWSLDKLNEVYLYVKILFNYIKKAMYWYVVQHRWTSKALY